MANKYSFQFNASYKPKMAQIDGFVSIGTGGQVNFPDQSGLGTPSGGSVSTGLPRGLLPGQSTLGVPTGWQGGFSGCIGLLGAGVQAVQRVGTGVFVVQLDSDYVRLDSCQIMPLTGGVSGGIDANIIDHTVGLGNSISTGGMTGFQARGNNPKNCIFIQFSGALGTPVDLASGSGFFLDIRVRDSLSGAQ